MEPVTSYGVESAGGTEMRVKYLRVSGVTVVLEKLSVENTLHKSSAKMFGAQCIGPNHTKQVFNEDDNIRPWRLSINGR